MSLRIESDFIHKGLHCLVIAQDMGHRCGYVGVSHNLGDAYGLGLEVHGGVTHEGGHMNDGLYYYGFDCAHSGDAKDESIMSEDYKKIHSQWNQIGGVVRTKEFVESECRKLADQLAPLVRADTYKKRLIEEVLN
jgi:hypothetical protein